MDKKEEKRKISFNNFMVLMERHNYLLLDEERDALLDQYTTESLLACLDQYYTMSREQMRIAMRLPSDV